MKRSVPVSVWTTAVLGVACVATIASSAFNFANTPTPGGFLQTCAGPSTSSGASWPGGDYFLNFPPVESDLHEASFTGDDDVQLWSAFSNSNTANSASGSAGMGYVRGVAHNDAPNNSSFASAVTNGGWSDTFLITSPGLDGQAGFMQFTLNAHGFVAAAGFAGSAGLQVTGYKNDVQLLANAYFDPGNSDLISSDRQYGNWTIATYGNPPSDSRTVDGVTTFAVPFTFGTSFDLGIYAWIKAGMRSSSGVPGNSTADANFASGLTWGGISTVYHNGAPIVDYSIQSGSAIDWSGAVAPFIPGDLNSDGVVDVTDLIQMLAAWGTPNGDINGDGMTSLTDLLLLLGNWS